MSVIPASVKCDGCEKSRVEDSNHWRSLDMREGNHILRICDGIAPEFDAHVCGETCALKLVSRWLSTGSLEEK